MNTIEKSDITKYFIAFNEGYTPFIFSRVDVGQRMETPMTDLEIFEDEAEWISRIDEIKGEGYYNSIYGED